MMNPTFAAFVVAPLMLPHFPAMVGQSGCESNMLEPVVQVLMERYYDQDFRENRIPALADRYRARASVACTLEEQRQVTWDFLSEIPTSHLSLLSGTAYRHFLADMFNEPTPTLGFNLVEIEGKHFAFGVLDQGPAAHAGLLRGDRVVTIDGHPVAGHALVGWRTDDAYLVDPATRAIQVEDGEKVRLEIERRPGAHQVLEVTARPYSLGEAFLASTRTYEQDGITIGYIHLWMSHLGAAATLQEKIDGELAASDALLIDLRGRGGVGGSVLAQLVSVLHDASDERGWPVVALVDRRSRSAKDAIAYELRKGGRALLVGERTSGAAMPAAFDSVGSDTYLMFPAFVDPVYSELLEFTGVEPHVYAPAPGPYSAGADPILESGLREAVRLARTRVPAERPTVVSMQSGTPKAPRRGNVENRSVQGDAQEVIRAMVDALGGEDAIRRHAAITQTGTYEILGAGISGPIVVRSAPPAHYRMKIELPGIGLMEMGYDGETGWQDNPMSGKSIMEGSTLDQMRRQANFYGPLGYDAVYTSVELAGYTDFNDVPTYELRLSFGDGQAARIFVDTTSYLIIGSKNSMQMMGRDIEVTTTYGEYRTFDGLRMSTEWVTDVGGMQQQKIVISDVSFRPHDAGTFDLPEWTEQNPGAGR